jgi:hypothetical protein
LPLEAVWVFSASVFILKNQICRSFNAAFEISASLQTKKDEL